MDLKKNNMKYLFLLFTLFAFNDFFAQELVYSIGFPPGAREGLGSKAEPTIIDTNHYYSYREIRKLAEPANGWQAFYDGVESLQYPKKAKAQKLQAFLTIEYRIDAQGNVDEVIIHNDEKSGSSSTCSDCEKLMLDYFKNTKWLPGKIGDEPVKTVDYSHVEFSIYDPKGKRINQPFGK